MPIDPKVKANWEKLQEKYNHPIDALGRPIDPKDQQTLRIWSGWRNCPANLYTTRTENYRLDYAILRLMGSGGPRLRTMIYLKLWSTILTCLTFTIE